MIYGIPSYKRPDCKTIDTLLNAGIDEKDIIVSLQDENEIKIYKEKHPNIRYIYRKTDSAGGNRNTILSTIKERPICLLDDDIVSFSIYTDDGRFIVNTKEGLSRINHICEVAQKSDCVMAGISPTSNSIIGRSRPQVSVDVLLQGSVLIVLSNDVFFDERFKMIEDYEIVLKSIYNGKHVVRSNLVSANKPKNGTNQGGMHDRYSRGELPIWLKRLEKVYPIFKANKKMTGGEIRWK